MKMLTIITYSFTQFLSREQIRNINLIVFTQPNMDINLLMVIPNGLSPKQTWLQYFLAYIFIKKKKKQQKQKIKQELIKCKNYNN